MAEIGFNLDQFKAKFKGGARSYLFLYKPIFPGGVGDITSEDAQYLVRTATLPETTLEEIIVNWQGYDWKLPGKYTYTDFTVTFNVDVKAKIRFAWEKWMTLIHDPETNVHALPEEFLVDQHITLLGYDGNPIMSYKLLHAWPKMIGPITLDYAAAEVAQFDVTLTYAYHTTSVATPGSGSGI